MLTSLVTYRPCDPQEVPNPFCTSISSSVKCRVTDKSSYKASSAPVVWSIPGNYPELKAGHPPLLTLFLLGTQESSPGSSGEQVWPGDGGYSWKQAGPL